MLYSGLLSLGTSDLGRALTAGDVDGDGRDELFATAGGVATPREVVAVHFAAGAGDRGGVGTAAEAGRVAVLYGSADGITAAGQQSWIQDSPGISSTAEAATGSAPLGC